jgi:hypothetical protein
MVAMVLADSLIRLNSYGVHPAEVCVQFRSNDNSLGRSVVSFAERSKLPVRLLLATWAPPGQRSQRAGGHSGRSAERRLPTGLRWRLVDGLAG